MHYASLCDDHPCTEIFVHASSYSFGNRFLESARMPLLKAPDNALPGCCPESGVGQGVPSCPHLYPTLALSAALQTGQPHGASRQNRSPSTHAPACRPGRVHSSVQPHFYFISYSCQKESPQVNSKTEAGAQSVCLGHVLLQPHIGNKDFRNTGLSGHQALNQSVTFHSQGSLPSQTRREK